MSIIPYSTPIRSLFGQSGNKGYTVDYLTKKRIKNDGAVPQYYVEDSHPAIIEPETFDRVQDIMGIRSRTKSFSGYLDWILFRKRLRYTLEMTKWKSAAYMDTMQELIPFTAGDIVKLPMPVDLYEAYGSYHYGIFACIN